MDKLSACASSLPLLRALYAEGGLMLPYVLIVLGVILSAVFAVLSMLTGMWGCGAPCWSFIGMFWVALAIVATGIVLLKRKSRQAKCLSHE